MAHRRADRGRGAARRGHVPQAHLGRVRLDHHARAGAAGAAALINAQPLTNGFNGLTDLGNFTLGELRASIPIQRATYYIVAVALALVLIGCAAAGRDPRRTDPPGHPRRPEPRPLSRLRRAGLSDLLLRRVGGDRGPGRPALRQSSPSSPRRPSWTSASRSPWWSGRRSAAATRCSAPASAPS